MVSVKRRFGGEGRRGRRMNAANVTEPEGERQSSGGRRRSVARLSAVQALYQLALNPGLGAEMWSASSCTPAWPRDRWRGLCEADEALFADIVRGVAGNRERLDEVIAGVIERGMPLRRLETSCA